MEIVSFLNVGNISSPTQSMEEALNIDFFICIKESAQWNHETDIILDSFTTLLVN